MKYSPSRSIRTHLLLLVAVSLLPALIIILYSGLTIQRKDIARAEADVMRVVRTLAYDHESLVESTQQFLLALARFPDVQNQDAKACNKLFGELLKENPLYANIFAATAEGMVFSNARPFTPHSIKDRKYYQDVLKTGAFSVGEYVIGVTLKLPVLHFAYPVRNSRGEFKGVVVVAFDLNRYGHIFNMEGLPPGSRINLTDHKNRVLYRNPNPEKHMGRTDSPNMIRTLLSKLDEGTFTGFGNDGTKCLYGYKRFYLKGTNAPYLFLRVGIPEEQALSQAKNELINNLILLGGAFLLAMALAWILGRKLIVKRLRRLAHAAQRLGHGDLQARTEMNHSRDELGILTKAFDEMAEVLENKEKQRESAEGALRESEKKFKAIADYTYDWENWIGTDGKLVWVNHGVERITGYSVEECLSMTDFPFSIIDETDHGKVAEDFEKAIQGLSSGNLEFRICCKDGKLKWGAVSYQPIYDESGNKLGHRSSVRDITEYKHAEEALKESEARYADLYENAPDMYLSVDAATAKVIQCNETLVRMMGFTRDEVIGRSIFELYHPDCREYAKNYVFPLYLEVGELRNIELQVARKDGSAIDVILNTTAVRDQNGKILQSRSIWRDITKGKQAEEEYRTLFREMLDGFALHEIICDEAGNPVDYKFLAVNPAFEQLTGMKAGDVIGNTVLEVMPQIEKSWIERYGQVALTGKPVFFEEYASELKKHFEVTAFRPAPNQFACIFADVTERKRAEEEKVKLQEQLIQAQKMESVGRLAGGVAHDFNNMLGVILGHVEMAMEQVDPTLPLHVDLQEIQKAAKRSADLTRQLLAFARKQTVSPKVLDMNETVAGMLKMLQRLIGEDIHLSWLPALNLWPVKIDPSQIDQILANMCVNARDAISGVGKVTIETGNIIFDEAYCADHTGYTPGEYVLLAVSDNGCGMSKETFGNLFEPFFTTKETGKGTGLGLATIYGIVKQNDGFINVYSEPGQGTTFRIYLPRHIGKGELALTEGLHVSISRGQETVLVVEDEPAILNLSRRMLEKQGYQVLTAGTPGEAIRLAEEFIGEIDLLMTDVVMPEMNGRDLAGKLLSSHPKLRLLFMSGYTANVIAHHGVLDDGVFFIQKPFSIKDLSSKVREALDQ